MSKLRFFASRFSLSFLALTLATAAVPVMAGEFDAPRSITVSYGDLDISSKAGAEKLLKRIIAAAETVCGPKPVGQDLNATRSYESCVNATVEKTVAVANSPTLAQVYSGEATTTVAQK